MVKVVAAYLLSNLAGVAAPAEADIKKILGAGELVWMSFGRFGGAMPCGCGSSPQMKTIRDVHAVDGGKRAGEGGDAASAANGASDVGRLALSRIAVGAEADSERIAKLLSELEGKDVQEVRGGAGGRRRRTQSDGCCRRHRAVALQALRAALIHAAAR